MSRRFQINRRPLTFTYVINDAGTPVYRVKIGTVAGTGPDLTLFDGPDETAPVLAVCHMPRFSLDYKIALGDPAAPETQWEDMVKTTVGGAEHSLSVTLSEDDRFAREGHGQRRELRWKRTRHEAVEGGSVRKSLRNWKLVEGDVVRAVFNDAAGAGVCGRLQIQEDRGRDFDVLVMITLLALYERRRRA